MLSWKSALMHYFWELGGGRDSGLISLVNNSAKTQSQEFTHRTRQKIKRTQHQHQDQEELGPGVQRWFDVRKSGHWDHCMNRSRKRRHTSLSEILKMYVMNSTAIQNETVRLFNADILFYNFKVGTVSLSKVQISNLISKNYKFGYYMNSKRKHS